MRLVTEGFEECALNDPSFYNQDLGVIPTAGKFQEQSLKRPTFMHHKNCGSIRAERRKFFASQLKDAVFCTPNRQRWMEGFLGAQPLTPAQVRVSSSEMGDIYSPIHLIEDALVSVYVWSY